MKKIWLLLLIFLAGCALWIPTGGPYKSAAIQFSAELPQGWMRLNEEALARQEKNLLITRDGVLLQTIRISRYPVNEPVKTAQKYFRKDMLPQELAEVVLDNIASAPGVLNFEVMENAPAQIDGISAFRLVFTYKNKEGLRYKSVCYGFISGQWVYRLQYSAPQRYYFEKDLAAFARVAETFRLDSAGKK